MIFTAICNYNFLNAQLGFEYAPNNIAINSPGNLTNAFGGGFNYAQVSELDIDYDGDMDLVVFDRTNNNIRVYEQIVVATVKKYRQLYNSRFLFPTDIFYRLYFADYDGDGKNDLFTSSIGGIAVYKNTGDAVNGLQWQLTKDFILTDYFGTLTNLYVPSSDIPAIIDVDNDGDLDVLTFGINGTHVEYHQNQSRELYGHSDSLIFELKNNCWGLFGEDLSTNVIILNDNSTDCTSGNVPNPLKINYTNQKEGLHAGSTVLALDYDNNGVLDLILGDISYSNLTLLINGGSAPNTNSAMISQNNAFPSNSIPVNLELFPAAFFIDVDFDGIKDLVVSGNAKNVSQNVQSIYFYKNTGSNALPSFNFQYKNLFQKDMIDHGTGSIPIISDIDKDGKKDLIISNFFRYKPSLSKESTMAYYKNTGTTSNPIFSLIDDDFLNLGTSGFGLRLFPAFGDLDNDSDQDLILGKDDGRLIYYSNTTSGSSPTFGSPTVNLQDALGTIIEVQQYASPQLFDLNEDGLFDLIIGDKNGKLTYYQNTGTAAAPVFTLVNNNLGLVDVTENGSTNGYATPHFFKLNNIIYLFAGAFNGKLYYYKNIVNNLGTGAAFDLVNNDFLQIDAQGYSAFYTDDIDNDGNLNMFVGTDLGGIYHFEVDPNSTANIHFSNIDFLVGIYPNPNNGIFKIKKDLAFLIKKYTITDVFGRIVNESNYLDDVNIDISLEPNGIYIVNFESATGEIFMRRIVKQ